MSTDPAALLREYVVRHNHAVRTGDFAALAALFQPRAIVEFVGIAFGPLCGRDAIARGFVEHPPNDELVLIEPVTSPAPGIAEASYRWAKRRTNPGGALHLQAPAGMAAIDRLTIHASRG